MPCHLSEREIVCVYQLWGFYNYFWIFCLFCIAFLCIITNSVANPKEWEKLGNSTLGFHYQKKLIKGTEEHDRVSKLFFGYFKGSNVITVWKKQITNFKGGLCSL